MPDCIFCKIISGTGKAEVVYETEYALAFLDIHPSARGHTLVIPKAHAETLDRLPDEHVGPLFLAVKAVMGLLENSLKPAGLNVGWNHGWAAGQRVNHLHVHLVPRFAGDGGTGVQFVVHGPVRAGIADTALQIRTCELLYRKG
jgi:histidine triad (HIT) family protein